MKRRRRVTRWLIAAALLLVGGAIVNVAVAWGAIVLTSMTWRLHPGDDWLEEDASPEQMKAVHAAFPDTTFGPGECLTTGSRRLGWDASDVRFIPEGAVGGMIGGPDPFDYPSVSHTSSGLPARSLQYVSTWSRNRGEHYVGRLVLPEAIVGRHNVVPLLPIWPGFAINTLFYAAILWMLFAAPFALRRWRRSRRGLCPACAYPIGTWGGPSAPNAAGR